MNLQNAANGCTFVEAIPGEQVIERGDDISPLVEATVSSRTSRVLLHASNLPPSFFDLSSAHAGLMLQKVMSYHIRLAILADDSVERSTRFPDFLAGAPSGVFRVFENRDEALEWLTA